MSLSHNGSSIVTNGLIACLDPANPRSYPGTGTAWTDLSGRGANATLNGTISFVNNGPASYFNFATASDSNFISSTLSQQYLDITIAFQPDFSRVGGANLAGLISSGTNTDKSLRFTSVNGTGPWSLATRNPGDGNDWANPTATTYYINGVATNTTSSGWNILSGYRTNQSGFPLNFAYHLGSSGFSGRSFQGRLGFVAMYNRQLSAAEVAQNYNVIRRRYGL